MLAYFKQYAAATGIAPHIRLNCTVLSRSAVDSGSGTLDVVYRDEGGQSHSLHATHVFAAPGRVNTRREVRFPGEASSAFAGVVAYGTGCDICPRTADGDQSAVVDFGRKHVVIVGHGSFAIENARHALESGAASVVLLARHEQVVMSRPAGLFVDRHADQSVSADAVLVALRNAYDAIGLGTASPSVDFPPPSAGFDSGSGGGGSGGGSGGGRFRGGTTRDDRENFASDHTPGDGCAIHSSGVADVGAASTALERMFFVPSRTMLPTSDFYFVARASGKLQVVIGEVARLQGKSVVTSVGSTLRADVVLKCVGFTQDRKFDQAMGADFKKGGRVATFHHSNSVVQMKRGSVFVGGSGGLRQVSPCYAFIAHAERLPARDLKASNAVLRRRVAERSRTRQSLASFLAEQTAEWAHYCTLLDVDVPYPYSLDDMVSWEAATLGLQHDHHARKGSKAARRWTEGAPFNLFA
jgi:cation diffusion facilitator CzcD-associated flavoprotein CzcO